MSDYVSDRQLDAPRPTSDGIPRDVTVASLPAPEGVDPAGLLSDADGLRVERVADAEEAATHLDGLDCVVIGALPADEDDLRTVLTDARTEDPALPVVFAAPAVHTSVVPAAFEADRTAVVPVEPPAAGARLAHRVRSLVAHRRSDARAERAASAAAAASDGLAVVDADGTVTFANRSFARLFDATPETVRDRPWQSLFEPEAAARLETDALAAVEDGWEWLGTCEGRRTDGEPVSLQVRVAGVEDDGFVVAATRSRSDDADGADGLD